MRRRSLTTPKWETRVNQTIYKVNKESKTRSLKSSDLYECVCIFISDHLKKQMFSYLEGVQTALERFFRSMRLRRLIKENQTGPYGF
ncbi:MAG: hypothetical protein KAT88_07250 [Spirochaetes bacterium]|nr:hypothetical protein [Spirochaetota bacterium]